MAGAASERLRKFFNEKEGLKKIWCKIWGMGAETHKNCESRKKFINFNKSSEESDLRLEKDVELRCQTVDV